MGAWVGGWVVVSKLCCVITSQTLTTGVVYIHNIHNVYTHKSAHTHTHNICAKPRLCPPVHCHCRYNEILLMVETCEANSLTNRISAPRIITMASSLKGKIKKAAHAETGHQVVTQLANRSAW